MKNNEEKSPIKYTVIYGVLLVLFSISAFAFVYPKARENLERVDMKGHYREYKESKRSSEIRSITVPLYSDTSVVYQDREIEALNRDMLHLALEALLLEESDVEKNKGLKSSIAKKTKLIGASGDNGYYFIELSKEFLKSEDIEKALKEIHLALEYYMNVKEITILSDGKTFKESSAKL